MLFIFKTLSKPHQDPREYFTPTNREAEGRYKLLICDVCNSEVMTRQGSLMTTQQVVSSYRYWEYTLKHQWAYFEDIDTDGGALFLAVKQQVDQKSPWLICDKCMSIFDVDRVQALSWCEKWWASNKTWAPPGSGPGSMEDALSAASEGWARAGV